MRKIIWSSEDEALRPDGAALPFVPSACPVAAADVPASATSTIGCYTRPVASPDDAGLEDALVSAPPEPPRVERDWVRAQVARSLFAVAVEPPRLGRFELRERLGSGGMGVVFRAHDPELERDVAVKVVSAGSRRDVVLAEAKALARLAHPNVVAVHDVGATDDVIYVVMEFVKGPTLREFAQEPRSAREIVAAYVAAGRGLLAAHEAGLVHRDFKPDNAMLGADGRVRVIDFGLASLEALDIGGAAGTPRYMAPEQRLGEASPASDQFAFCVSLREALDARSDREIPGWVDAALQRGECADPKARFDSMEALLRALGRDPKVLWRRRGLVAAAAIGLTAAYGIGSLGNEEEAPCADAPAQIEAAWPAERRRAALTAIASVDPDYGPSAAKSLDDAATAFEDRWAREHRDACLASRAGQQSHTMLDRRMACLDRAASAYESAATITGLAEPSTVPNLVLTFRSLPEVEQCSDAQHLTAVAPPPALAKEPARRLSALTVEFHAGDFAALDPKLDPLVEELEGIGYAPLLAEGLILRAKLDTELARSNAAEENLTRALSLALAAGDDHLAVRAWASRSYIRGTFDSDPPLPEALEGLEVIQGVTQRIPTSTVAGELHTTLGNVFTARGQRDQARDAFERAFEILSVKDPPIPGSAKAAANLAITIDDAARRKKQADEAILRWAEVAGPHHPRTLNARAYRASQEEDPNTSSAMYAPVCAAMERFHPSLARYTLVCHYHFAFAAEAAKDISTAKLAMERVAGRDAKGYAQIAEGYLALWGGDPSTARSAFEDLLAGFPSEPKWWTELLIAEAELGLSRALRQLEVGDASVHFERAVERLTRIGAKPHLAEARMRVAFARSL